MTDGEGLQINVSRCRTLVDLERKKKNLEEELKKTKAKISELYKPIASDFTRAAVKSLPLKTGERLIPRRSLYCNKRGGVPTALAILALRKAGLEHLTGESYDSSGLKDWVKDREAEMVSGGHLPENLNDVLPKELREFFSLHDETKIIVQGINPKKKGDKADG